MKYSVGDFVVILLHSAAKLETRRKISQLSTRKGYESGPPEHRTASNFSNRGHHYTLPLRTMRGYKGQQKCGRMFTTTLEGHRYGWEFHFQAAASWHKNHTRNPEVVLKFLILLNHLTPVIVLKHFISSTVILRLHLFLILPFPYDQLAWGPVGNPWFLGGGRKHNSFMAPPKTSQSNNGHVQSSNWHVQSPLQRTVF